MCYSNCKNENHQGECSKRIDKYDTSLHCFEGFVCDHCNEIFIDDSCISDLDNTCQDCKADLDEQEKAGFELDEYYDNAAEERLIASFKR